jgi:hypothetical protein
MLPPSVSQIICQVNPFAAGPSHSVAAAVMLDTPRVAFTADEHIAAELTVR